MTSGLAGSVEGQLYGYGRVPWDAVRDLLRGMTAVWADLDGFHVGDVPARAPAYTHVWGWGDGRLARVRIDGGEGIVAVLQLPGAPDAPDVLGLPPVRLHERVEVRVGDFDSWSPEDKQVPDLGRELLPGAYRVWSVQGGQPLDFVSGAEDRVVPGTAFEVVVGEVAAE